MNPKFNMKWLLNEADPDGGDNGGDGEIIDVENVEGEEGDAEEVVDLNDGGTGGGSSNLTPDAIAEADARGLGQRGGGSNQNPQQQPELTQEEFLKQMGRVEVDPRALEDFFKPDAPLADKAKWLQTILDNHAQHVLKVAGVAQNFHVSQLQQKYDPLLQRQEREKEENFYKTVATKYPSLKPHSKIIAIAAQQLRQSGYQSKGVEADHHALAVAAARLVASVDKTFVLKRAKGGGRAGMPAMAASATGAGGGGARSGASTNKKVTPALALYQK
jgi:hypothetical protein